MLSDLTLDQMHKLARRLRVSLQNLTHYRSGRRRASAGQAIKIERAARGLGLDVRRESLCDACRGCDLAKKARGL